MRAQRFPILWMVLAGLTVGGCGDGETEAPAPLPETAPSTQAAPATSPAARAVPSPSNDPYSGRYETLSDGVRYGLELTTSDGQRYAGTVVVDGARYPLTGTVQDRELRGRFNDPDGSSYDYRAIASPGGLTFLLDGDDLVEFNRVAGGTTPGQEPSRTFPSPPVGQPVQPPAPGSAAGGWPPPPPPPR